jgi:3',5'-cyclic AMP phosphodiesterase CpdA
MILAQISDTHILAKTSDDPAAISRAEDLRRCIADINARGVDAVIHTGDSVHHGSPEEYAHLRAILSGIEAPLYFTPGNRDRKEGLRAALDGLAHLPDGDFLHHAVEDHDLRLVALDSVTAGERKGTFCSERLAWLEQTLSRGAETPTVLFMHHPPFDIVPYYEGGYRRPQDTKELAALVRRHPQVIRLICGHAHCMHTTEWAGIIATCMPSIAVDLRKGVDASFGTTPVYALHTSSPDGSVATQFCAVGQ